MKEIIIMNPKAQFAVNTLKLYAKETGNITRGTTDISPLEEWLILRLFSVSKCNCDKPEHWVKTINGKIIDYCKICNLPL